MKSKITETRYPKPDWEPQGRFDMPSPADSVVPPTLREFGIEKLLGLHVWGSGAYVGTYGMGGPGFVGIILVKPEDTAADNPEVRQMLTLRLWGAAGWLHWDNKLISWTCPDHFDANSGKTERQHGTKEWVNDIIGCILTSAEIHDKHSRFVFTGGDKEHVLELKKDPKARPRCPGKLEGATEHARRELAEQDSLWDAWIVSPDQFLVV